MNKYVLGISGFMGSGKTAAGEFFQKLGAHFIDADQVVDGLYQKGEDGYRKILSFFGEEYFKKNGELNRKKLAKDVFGDPKKLRILHDLIHPLVTTRVQKMIDQGGPGIFVVEATYFDKKHLRALIDGLLWLDCPRDVLLNRIRKSRPMDPALFAKILRVQVKPSAVDFEVNSNCSRKDFEDGLMKVWESVRKS